MNSKNGKAPKEYIDYILMTKLWNCPPSVFYEQDEGDIALAIEIWSLENRQQWKEQKREEQLQKMKFRK